MQSFYFLNLGVRYQKHSHYSNKSFLATECSFYCRQNKLPLNHRLCVKTPIYLQFMAMPMQWVYNAIKTCKKDWIWSALRWVDESLMHSWSMRVAIFLFLICIAIAQFSSILLAYDSLLIPYVWVCSACFYCYRVCCTWNHN